MKGVPKYKLGAANLTRRHIADKFLYGARALVNIYQCAKFQLPSSNSFGDTEGSKNKKWGADNIDR